MSVFQFPTVNLPHVLLCYARGETGFEGFPLGTFPAEERRIARECRKSFFRHMQRENPGLQYSYPDYNQLMRVEIAHHAKNRMEKQALRCWADTMSHCPRLRGIHQTKERFELDHLKNFRPATLRHMTLETRRHAFRLATLDPRALGELEQYLLGTIMYGMPSWRNDSNETD